MITSTRDPEPPATEVNRFDESIGLDDPHPGKGWLPSPRQIREWSAIIREEREAARREEENDVSTMRWRAN